MDAWYLLYDGSSPDGRGAGNYIGRTTDKKVAKAHFKKCAEDPYSTGGVTIVTDTKAWRACREDFYPPPPYPSATPKHKRSKSA